MQHQRCSRIDLGDLKAHIAKTIGAERSKRYFFYLNKYLSKKLSKSDFDKFCYRAFGRENLSLHNQFIRSILKNACQSKTPPPVHEAGPTKSAIQVAKSSSSRDDGLEHAMSVAPNQNHSAPIWSNGVLPVSSRKGRSGIRERKLRDRPSPLGPNGKVECVQHQSSGTEDSSSKVVMENGELAPCDYQRPVQHLRAVAEQQEIKREGSVQRPMEKPRIRSRSQNEVPFVEDGEEVEQANHFHFLKGPLLAPLGIPFCSASAGGARSVLPLASSGDYMTFYDNGGLSDADTLRKRMEQIAASQGLGEVSMESANVLNSMLDVYLKRLIRSCVELVGGRSTPEHRKYLAQKQQIQNKVINGMRASNHFHMQSGSGPLEVVQDQRPQHSISVLDFKVAMELNPQQLGEDWPLLLEKISMHAFDE